MNRLVIDLIDLSQYSEANDEYRYVLDIIDAFSQFAWAYPAVFVFFIWISQQDSVGQWWRV